MTNKITHHISSLSNNLPFLGTVKSSFICYGTWEKLVHCIQTLILTTDTAVALNQLENTVSDSQPWTREPLWKSTEVSSKERFQHTVVVAGWVGGGVQRCALERVRGTVWFYSSHPFPKVTQLRAKRELLGSDFSHRPEVRDRVSMWLENLASPAVDDVVKEFISLASSRVCSSELLDWRVVVLGWEKKADSSLTGLQRDIVPTNQTMDSIKKPLWDTLPLDSCSWPTGTLIMPHASLIYSPTHLWRFSCVLPMAERMNPADGYWAWCRKPAHICRTRRSHKLEL